MAVDAVDKGRYAEIGPRMIQYTRRDTSTWTEVRRTAVVAQYVVTGSTSTPGNGSLGPQIRI